MKPVWALQIGNAMDLERQAEMIREEARFKRCPAEESGGQQCTRDRHDDDRHRIFEEDLP
jgi:hypothetical protein